MYGCESWTIKKTDHQRMDAFELWCWRRLLRVHWTAVTIHSDTGAQENKICHWSNPALLHCRQILYHLSYGFLYYAYLTIK